MHGAALRALRWRDAGCVGGQADSNPEAELQQPEPQPAHEEGVEEEDEEGDVVGVPEPPAQPVERVVRPTFVATGLPELLGQRRTEVEAVTVQLVGITPLGGAVQPNSHLRFVVRFYDFTSAVTPPVSLHPLGGGHAPYVVVSKSLPEWASAPTTHNEFTGVPGIVVRFEVPGDASESGLLGWYTRFGGCMQIEAWDDASLLHVGTAWVPLAELAHGKPEVWHEVALLEPVLPLQDERRAGRCCGLLWAAAASCGAFSWGEEAHPCPDEAD